MTPGPWNWLCYPDGRKLLTGPNNAVIHCPDSPIGIDADDMARIERVPQMEAALTEAKHAVLAAAGYIGGVSVLDRAGINATLRRAMDAIKAASPAPTEAP